MPPGKTAPRLLQDLLTYDARYEEAAGRNLLTSAPPHHDSDAPKAAAVPGRNCRHRLHTKSEQSELPPAGEELEVNTVYKVASYCSQCRWHIDLVVDSRGQPSKTTLCHKGSEYPLHHLLFDGEDDFNGASGLSAHRRERRYDFRCSAPDCPVIVTIHVKPPHFSQQDVEALTNKALLRRRWEAAKQLAGDRADTTMARPVDAPDYLNTYLLDSMNPVKGKTRIPLLNRKFLKTFGKDCDSILERLGFRHELEKEEDGVPQAEVWYLPQTNEATNPLETTSRTTIEDARYELNTILLNFPDLDRNGCRHQPMYPTPSVIDLERVLACRDYNKVKGRVETRSTSHEEDHPYYASLGALSDFTDELILWAFARQAELDHGNHAYYFECLQDLANGRNSEALGMHVGVLASQGFTSKRELDSAYRYFGIDPKHAPVITDDNIIGAFKARLPDISPALADEARKQLRVLGDARNSEKIRAEAAEAIETEEQALSWLDLEPGAADDFVQTMFSIKTQDNPGCIETARRAVTVIADKRQSSRLREFLEKGTMTEPDMDVGEAYALYSVNDRTVQIDLEVLKSFAETATLEEAEKYQKAFSIIQQDQAQNHGNKLEDSTRPEARRNNYPLESWPVGLRNIGNTCYLNSVLQFLFTIKPLRELILSCEGTMQDVTPEALKEKKVGRTVVTVERVEIAQKFVRELRTLFEHMNSASTDTVRPELELASLALCRTDRPEEEKPTTSPAVDLSKGAGLGAIDGIAVIGPMPLPTTPPDSVMDDANSVSSMQAMDMGGQNEKPAAPTRPPPVPPRRSRIGIVEDIASQQDAAEVMGNIFDLISCAIQGEDLLRDGEQLDAIKKLFFSDVTTVRGTAKGDEKQSELRHNYLVSPDWRDRHLYATLDDDFGQQEDEGGLTRYDYIDEAAPIQIINVRRVQWNREKKQQEYDRSQIKLDSTVYFDRYLRKTATLGKLELLKLREVQWEKQRELRDINAQKKRLQDTGIDGMELVDAVEEAGAFVSGLLADKLSSHDQSSLPTPPPELATGLDEKANYLKKEVEQLNARMSHLESEIDTVFNGCKDHPYRLHAVFTHRGASAKGGHYWIYIYDFQNDMWRTYNDERVEPVDEKEIFEGNPEEKFPKTSTGVVYIRADLVETVTDAVWRNPVISETKNEGIDVEMEDADDPAMPPLVALESSKAGGSHQYDNMQVIEGIESQ